AHRRRALRDPPRAHPHRRRRRPQRTTVPTHRRHQRPARARRPHRSNRDRQPPRTSTPPPMDRPRSQGPTPSRRRLIRTYAIPTANTLIHLAFTTHHKERESVDETGYSNSGVPNPPTG